MATAKKTIKKEAKTTKAVSSVQTPKAEKKTVAKKPTVTESPKKSTEAQKKKSVVSVESSLKISVVDAQGKAAGTMTLPEVVFGAKVNPTLMAQAVRVYLANQRQGNASTKTRGEVEGSTRKIYRQKGTGRARHGAVRAPIFVKGGIAHGPHPRDYSLSLPVKMKRAALFSALTAQHNDGHIVVVSGFENVGPKTKQMASALKNIGVSEKNKTLVVMPRLMESVYKAGRNIQGISLSSAHELSAYAVLTAGKIVFMKEAVEAVEKTFVKGQGK